MVVLLIINKTKWFNLIEIQSGIYSEIYRVQKRAIKKIPIDLESVQ